ncbi:MAG: DUF4406 domain-containing protein [Oscillospiraceae bacterium]|nr:DUF4406 domain-containing protein [Oscillospiraceae bacterium]
MKTVYLAGKITGDEGYREKFAAAARELELAGFVVCNPAMLPYPGFEYDQYLRMSAAMLEECEAVCFLPDWVQSNGARLEYAMAIDAGKEIFYYREWIVGRS